MGPSHKAAARFGSRSPRFWVPQKNGAEKEDIFMSYLYVKWNSFGRGLLASGLALKHVIRLSGHSRNGGLRRRRRRA
jgi:hypothetical protein